VLAVTGSCDVITSDQNWHHLYSSSAGGNWTQCRETWLSRHGKDMLKLCITAMINQVFTSFSAVQIHVYGLSCINLHSSLSTGILWTHIMTGSQLASVSRTLHQYCQSHGYKTCSGLNFFQASLLLKLCITAMINFMSSWWLKTWHLVDIPKLAR